MARALRACPTAGCHELTPGGRCATCKAKAEAERGTAKQRGYGALHRRRFRAPILRRDVFCTCTDTTHGHGPECLEVSTEADHWPLTKRELREQGLDEHDPKHGRGLCKACHSKHTAKTSPGGWNHAA